MGICMMCGAQHVCGTSILGAAAVSSHKNAIDSGLLVTFPGSVRPRTSRAPRIPPQFRSTRPQIATPSICGVPDLALSAPSRRWSGQAEAGRAQA